MFKSCSRANLDTDTPGSHASAATFALKTTGKFGRRPDFIDANVAFRRYFVQTVITELLRSGRIEATGKTLTLVLGEHTEFGKNRALSRFTRL